MVAYEYDGERFHEEPNQKRDNELERIGWKIIHVNKNNMQTILDDITKSNFR